LKRQPIDRRTDNYAAGIMLYEMLAGQRPFDEAHEVLLQEKIIKGTMKNITECNEKLPTQLNKLFSNLLTKNIQDRPDNLGGIVGELEVLLGSATQSEIAVYLNKHFAPMRRELEGRLRQAIALACGLAKPLSNRAPEVGGGPREKTEFVPQRV